MKIKTKLSLWLALLVGLIVLLGGTSALYIQLIKLDTSEILHENYQSLVYVKQMLVALRNKEDNHLIEFDQFLKQQEVNATEKAEKTINAYVRKCFNSYKETGKTEDLEFIQQWLLKLMEVNIDAIEQKSIIAYKTTIEATLWIIITGSGCLVISIMLWISLPYHIANPIEKMINSIKQISESNYKERLYLNKNNEFIELAEAFNMMAEKLEEYNNSQLAKLLMQKKRIEALINIMGDVVIGLDEKMNVIFVNDEGYKILGLMPEEILGKSSSDIALNNDLFRLLLKLIDSQYEEKELIKIIYNEKENYYKKELLHIEIVPTGEIFKKVVGHVIILRNITEFKELDLSKSRFITAVSHEFKAPITSMKLSMDSLLGDKVVLTEKQKLLVGKIQEDVERLFSIISELMNFSQIESGKVILKVKQCAIEDIVRSSIKTINLEAEQKGIKIEVDIPEKMKCISIDSEKTGWVLTNLISNAVKYSHESGKVIVTVYQDSTYTKIQIKDEGMGIPLEYLQRIFDKYFRVPGTHRLGTGLGLSISKELIEAQNGRIEVESEYGVGTVFTLVFYT